MADVSEDYPTPSTNRTARTDSSNAYPSPALTPAADNDADREEDEELLDFGLLLSPAASRGKKPPSRGIKDFEEDGTRLQSSALRASRAAMHQVMSAERVHGRNIERAVWDGVKGGGAWVTKEGGSWMQSVGKSCRVANPVYEEQDETVGGQESQKKTSKWMSKLWLFPEEVLWLVERGSLDIRWPAMPGQGEDEELPMSLQGAYSAFLGGQEERGLTLEKYTVYQYLKRAGYVVVRAEENQSSIPKADTSQQKPDVPKSGWNTLWASFFSRPETEPNRQISGPLVRPGLYRDYGTIYRLLTLIPFHDPQTTASPTSQDHDPSVTYHVYKPTSTYKKSHPGPPDFYIAVINARQSAMPTEAQIDGLLRQTPFHPPKKEDPNVYRKVKSGYRNVILAVVDQGMVSFLNVADAGFGECKLWEKRAANRKGGFSGKGQTGRGRGR